LLVAAKRGNIAAIAALEGPECPESLRDLLALAQRLHGRSGATMSGLAPLTYTTIRHYRKECGLPRFTESDIERLILLDAVMLSHGEPTEGSE
jgi:hypothetical protein